MPRGVILRGVMPRGVMPRLSVAPIIASTAIVAAAFALDVLPEPGDIAGALVVAVSVFLAAF